MLRYLRRQDRDNLLFLSCMYTYLESVIPEFDRMKIDNTTKGKIKTARTHLNKAIKAIITQIDKDFYKELKKDSDRHGVLVLLNKDAQYELKKYKDFMGNVVLSREELDDLIMEATWQCVNCKCNKEEAKKCKLRELFIKLQAPIFDPEAEVCAWQVGGNDV